jgi:hypothetical protein
VCSIVLFLQRIILFIGGKCLDLKLPISACNTSLIIAPNNIIEQNWILITNVSEVVCL